MSTRRNCCLMTPFFVNKSRLSLLSLLQSFFNVFLYLFNLNNVCGATRLMKAKSKYQAPRSDNFLKAIEWSTY
jgi:hypothetical protein